MTLSLNERAHRLVDEMITSAVDLRIKPHDIAGRTVLDCGIETAGGLNAGLMLARVTLADLGTVSIVPGSVGELTCPLVQVFTDHPVAACMASQYAGWQVSLDLSNGKKYFAMGSGPMRSAAGREELFARIGFRETSLVAVGVFETRKLPPAEVLDYLCERSNVPPTGLSLLVAPTASQAGTIQIVARSVETALHKLLELGFDISRVVSGCGTAPLPPVAADDMSAIGRTNDAILYGGRVTLWLRGDDPSIEAIGARVPSAASPDYGAPFGEIFERAGRDFYKIDPHLFSPAEITFVNLDSGRLHRFGRTDADVLAKSFGIALEGR